MTVVFIQRAEADQVLFIFIFMASEIKGGESYFVGRPWSVGVKPKPLRIWAALAGALADSMASSSWYTFCRRAEWSPSGLKKHTNQAFVIPLLWFQICCTFCSWMISIWATNTHKPIACYSFSVISYLGHLSQLWWASPSGLKIHTNQAFAILFLWFQIWYTFCSCAEWSLQYYISHSHIWLLFSFHCRTVCVCVSVHVLVGD